MKEVLKQNQPNPFNHSTTIHFYVHKSGLVRLDIFNGTGKLIANLVQEQLQVGSFERVFYPENLNSGVFYYRLMIEDYIEIKKSLYLK